MDGKFLARVFGVPVGILVLGCVPGVSWFLYSGHGGLAWLILPFCFPYILVMLVMNIWKLPATEKSSGAKVALASVLAYIVVAYPLTRGSERYIHSTLGLRLLPGTIFKQATFPLGKILPPHYTREEMENPDLYWQRQGHK